MFDRQPSLNGALISLRPVHSDDFNALYAVANDPLLWAGHPSTNRYQLSVFKPYFDDALNSKGALIVIDNQTKQVIGTSRYHGFDKIKSEIEIGWTFLARSHWGGTFNKELKKLMLQHAFKYVQTVALIIEINNVRSQKAAEKIGSKLVDSHFERGGQINVVYHLSSAAIEKLK